MAFEGIKFPCRHTLFRVFPHLRFLYKLWILFSYISYAYWHSSRIFTSRILNKILRNFLPFVTNGKGPMRNPWCIKPSNRIHIQLETEISPRNLSFHVSYIAVKLENLHNNHSWFFLQLFVTPYPYSKPRMPYRGLVFWFVNTFFMLDIKKLFLHTKAIISLLQQW